MRGAAGVTAEERAWGRRADLGEEWTARVVNDQRNELQVLTQQLQAVKYLLTAPDDNTLNFFSRWFR